MKKPPLLSRGGVNQVMSGLTNGQTSEACRSVALTTATALTAAATGAGLRLVDADQAAHPLDVLEVSDGLGFVGLVGNRWTARRLAAPIMC